MALYLDSPARDAAAGSTDTVDQRGFPVAGVPDLGAYEAGPFVAGNPATALAEALPGNAPPGSTLPDGDFDGDGASNVQEIAAGTSLTNPASIFRITAVEKASGLFVLSFPTVSGRIYTLQQSASLAPGSWSSAGGASLTGDGSVKSFTVPVGGARKFHRVQASTP
jgi:hypothetical protein